MPLYEYECGAHGFFEAQRSLSDFDAAGVCPTCQGQSSRVLSAPRLRLTGRSERVARDRNERSQNEPRSVTREGASSAEGGSLRASTGGHPWAIGH
jgi:putative FmdB family regulatory protein